MTHIIGIGCVAGSGKDEAARALVEQMGFTRLAFADELKEIALELDIVNRPLCEALGWGALKRDAPFTRAALINLGETMRRHDPDFWVRLLMAKVDEKAAIYRMLGRRHDTPRVVIPDVRYANEAQAIKDRGGIVICVDRPGFEPVHESECVARETIDWDALILNHGDIAWLHEQAVDWASHFVYGTGGW